MLEIFNQEYHDILVQKQLLQRELEIQFKQGKRKENYNYCHNLVDAVYDITEAIHTDLQNKDKKEIEKKFWD